MTEEGDIDYDMLGDTGIPMTQEEVDEMNHFQGRAFM